MVGGANVVVVEDSEAVVVVEDSEAVVVVEDSEAVVVVDDGDPMFTVTVAIEHTPAELQIEYWKVSLPGSPPLTEYLTLGDPLAIALADPRDGPDTTVSVPESKSPRSLART